jgi:predicted DNA-binding antitoxin AbrB/MazE fold protein
MSEILNVIFENGVFRPLTPTRIPEGKRLKIRMGAAGDSLLLFSGMSFQFDHNHEMKLSPVPLTTAD